MLQYVLDQNAAVATTATPAIAFELAIRNTLV
jgi:hypothetical protein